MNTNLIDAVAAHMSPPSLTFLTGGGGKTTLMFALARRLSRLHTVAAATTTKIYAPSQEEGGELILAPELSGAWERILKEKRRVTLGAALEHGKVLGLSPAFIDAVYNRGTVDCLLVEADGAQRLPFKAYENHEPVPPLRATLQIVVLGAEIFLRPLGKEIAFRAELLEKRRGLRPGKRISLEDLGFLLDHPAEYAQHAVPGAPRLLLVNKCDLAGTDWSWTRTADAMAGLLQTYDFIYYGSVHNNILYEIRRLARPLRPKKQPERL